MWFIIYCEFFIFHYLYFIFNISKSVPTVFGFFSWYILFKWHLGKVIANSVLFPEEWLCKFLVEFHNNYFLDFIRFLLICWRTTLINRHCSYWYVLLILVMVINQILDLKSIFIFEGRIVSIYIFELHTKYTVNSWKFKSDSTDGS